MAGGRCGRAPWSLSASTPRCGRWITASGRAPRPSGGSLGGADRSQLAGLPTPPTPGRPRSAAPRWGGAANAWSMACAVLPWPAPSGRTVAEIGGVLDHGRFQGTNVGATHRGCHRRPGPHGRHRPGGDGKGQDQSSPSAPPEQAAGPPPDRPRRPRPSGRHRRRRRSPRIRCADHGGRRGLAAGRPGRRLRCCLAGLPRHVPQLRAPAPAAFVAAVRGPRHDARRPQDRARPRFRVQIDYAASCGRWRRSACLLGLVMVYSASIATAEGSARRSPATSRLISSSATASSWPSAWWRRRLPDSPVALAADGAPAFPCRRRPPCRCPVPGLGRGRQQRPPLAPPGPPTSSPPS